MSYARFSDPNDARRRAIMVRLLPILIGLVVMGFTAIRGCQPGPFGRHQVVAINPQQEAALGAQAFAEVLQSKRVITRGPLADAVRNIARRLVAASREPGFLSLVQQPAQDFEWEIELVDGPEVNAFCLPGGKMVVYTAITPVARTDAGLATVVAHEISHALAHHGAERMAHTQLTNIGLTAAGATMGDVDPQTRGSLLRALNAGAQFGILSYGRGHESEADHMGLLMMAAAGYDPEESIRFWERMQQVTGGKSPPEFLSTHPSHSTRIADLQRWQPEARKLYDAAKEKTKATELPDVTQ